MQAPLQRVVVPMKTFPSSLLICGSASPAPLRGCLTGSLGEELDHAALAAVPGQTNGGVHHLMAALRSSRLFAHVGDIPGPYRSIRHVGCEEARHSAPTSELWDSSKLLPSRGCGT